MERLMRHLSANEYRDSWAEREQTAGRMLRGWVVLQPPTPVHFAQEAMLLSLLFRPGLTARMVQHLTVYKTWSPVGQGLHGL